MGYIKHEAVVVTSFRAAELERVCEHFRQQMPEGFKQLLVGPIRPVVNGDATYFLAPDGSKEGWQDSETGDALRADFIAALKDERDLFPDIVHISYGGDHGHEIGTRVEFTTDFEPSEAP